MEAEYLDCGHPLTDRMQRWPGPDGDRVLCNLCGRVRLVRLPVESEPGGPQRLLKATLPLFVAEYANDQKTGLEEPQVLVTLWPDGKAEVALRPDEHSTWSPPTPLEDAP